MYNGQVGPTIGDSVAYWSCSCGAGENVNVHATYEENRAEAKRRLVSHAHLPGAEREG